MAAEDSCSIMAVATMSPLVNRSLSPLTTSQQRGHDGASDADDETSGFNSSIGSAGSHRANLPVPQFVIDLPGAEPRLVPGERNPEQVSSGVATPSDANSPVIHPLLAGQPTPHTIDDTPTFPDTETQK